MLIYKEVLNEITPTTVFEYIKEKFKKE